MPVSRRNVLLGLSACGLATLLGCQKNQNQPRVEVTEITPLQWNPERTQFQAVVKVSGTVVARITGNKLDRKLTIETSREFNPKWELHIWVSDVPISSEPDRPYDLDVFGQNKTFDIAFPGSNDSETGFWISDLYIY